MIRYLVLILLIISSPAYAGLKAVVGASVTAGSIAAAIQTQSGCMTAGYVWVPASNTCVAVGSGTVTSVTFTGDGTVLSSTPSSAVTSSGTLTATLANQTANTVLGALTATTPSDLAVPSCSTSTCALQWTSGVGFGTNTSVNAATLGGATFASPGAIGGSAASTGAFTTLTSGAHTITSTSATALTVGTNGTTNPIFAVNDNTASAVAGLSLTGAATGGTVALATTDSGSNNNLSINALGTGTISIGNVSTGAVSIGTSTISLAGNLTTAGGFITTGAFTPTFAIGGTNTYTFPGSNMTIAGINKAQTWTAAQTISTGTIAFTSTGTLQANTRVLGSGTALSTCAEAGTGSPTCSYTASDGSFTEKITLAASSAATTITLTFPNSATNMYICDGFDATTTTIRLKQTGGGATSAILTYYNDAGSATSPGATDVLYVKCLGN